MQLWPPNFDPENLNQDVPNEGLMLTEDSVVDCHGDYQGHIIIDRVDSIDQMIYTPLIIIPTKHPEYIKAYGILCECFECLWTNPVAEEISWTSIIETITQKLKAMGWVEMEAVEDHPTIFWKVK